MRKVLIIFYIFVIYLQSFSFSNESLIQNAQAQDPEESIDQQIETVCRDVTSVLLIGAPLYLINKKYDVLNQVITGYKKVISCAGNANITDLGV
jgi:hypothetical protein